MSSSAMRVVAVLLGVLAIILAIVGWRMSQNYAASAEKAKQQATQAEQKPAVPQILVVVATKPLAANVAIDSNDVVLAPVTVAPTEYFANVEDVVGRTPLVDLDAGQPVTPRFFKDTNQIARRVPPGHRALALKVDDVVGIGGFVRPGDIVDVLVFIKSATDAPAGDKRLKADDIATQARMLLKDVLVLSYEEHLVEPPKGIEKQDPNKQAQQRRERTAVVAIPEEQVQRVLLGASVGDLRLALHGAQTTETAAAAGNAPAAGATPPISDVSASAVPVPAAPDAKGKAPEPPPDGVITELELTRLQKGKLVGGLPPPKPRVEVIRGSKRESVYP